MVAKERLEQRLAVSGIQLKNKIKKILKNKGLFCLRKLEGGDPIFSGISEEREKREERFCMLFFGGERQKER